MTGFYMKAPLAINGLSIYSANSQALNNNIIEKIFLWVHKYIIFLGQNQKQNISICVDIFSQLH